MKTGFLITARLASSRLPLKLLMDLKGKKVIEWVIERALSLRGIEEIILCTSSSPQDRPLIEIARDYGIYYFAGDENDVLKRLYEAARLFSLDYFVGITGENTLFARYQTQQLIDLTLAARYDFIKIKDVPIGCATYGVKVSAVKEIVEAKETSDTEEWERYFDPSIYNISYITPTEDISRPHYRLTLEYIEDYKLLRHLFHSIPFSGLLELSDVVEAIDRDPQLLEINRYVPPPQSNPDVEAVNRVVAKIKEMRANVS